jgi:hypothetical protein
MCFEKVVKATSEVVANRLKFHFSRYAALQSHLQYVMCGPNEISNSRYQNRMLILSELLKKHQKTCFALLQTIIEAELTPFTQNFHYLESSTDKWLSAFKEVRAGKLPQDFGDERPQVVAGASSPFTFGVYHKAERNQPRPTTTFQISVQEEAAKPFTFRAPAKIEQSERRVPTSTSQVSADPELAQNTLAALAKMGYTGITQADLGRLIPADEYQRELQVMAEVRAYFQVAYKVCNTVKSRLLVMVTEWNVLSSV